MRKILMISVILIHSHFCFSNQYQGRPRSASAGRSNSLRGSANNWKLGFGLGYSPNYMVDPAGSGSLAGAPYTIKYELEYKSATSIQLDYWNLSNNSFGFISGVQYETQRTISKAKLDGINVNVDSATFAKFQTNFLYAGVAYKWNIFYIPLGLTYGLNTIVPAAGPGATTTENGFGFMWGLGWFLKDDIVIEYASRTAAIKIKYVNGADFENVSGTVATSILNLKYFF